MHGNSLNRYHKVKVYNVIRYHEKKIDLLFNTVNKVCKRQITQRESIYIHINEFIVPLLYESPLIHKNRCTTNNNPALIHETPAANSSPTFFFC